MDILLELLFSFLFELLPTIVEFKGREPRSPEEE